MARQRHSAFGLRRLLQILAGLIWIGTFLALFRKLGGEFCEPFPIASSLGATLIAALWARRTPPHQLQQSALVKAEAIIQRSIEPLARRRAQLVYMDDYGSPHLETWEAEIDNFVTRRILPMLGPEERIYLERGKIGMLRLLTLRTLNGIDEVGGNGCTG